MSSGIRTGRRIIWSIVAVCSFGTAVAAADDRPAASPKTNLEIMQALVVQLAGEVRQRSQIAAGVDSLELRVAPSDDRWIVEQGLSADFTSHGFRVFARDSVAARTKTIVEINGVELNVRYDDIIHTGLFGPTMVVRGISAGFTAQALAWPSGNVLCSGVFQRTVSDTVEADDIPSLELASAKCTHADLPPDNFINRAVEPFIIIGATGVIVYLLFHVRS